ncbi:helix-turn-helix domain-containing protein [Devosia sp.]|uniref:helix-turn-helix domain-containing protein n=1 Tax=Devosia sp. TaxID=1871048 RepID=UPI002AFEAEE9|nr:hypothetical protein [Devosia sp.]
MRLDYRLPSAPLGDWITVHACVGAVATPGAQVLPAMLPNLHVWLGGEGRYIFADGTEEAAPRIGLLGPTSAAYRIELDAGAMLVATGFLPAGWRALVGAPATEFADRLIAADRFWPHRALDRLFDRMLDTAGDAERCRLVEDFLVAHARDTPDPLGAQGAAIEHWLETSAGLRLDTLGALLDVGPRHMRRLTLELYGISPKTLAMKYRALRAAAALALYGQAGLEAAVTPFADQAHLTRDFGRFVGWTPSAFIQQNQNVAARTLEGRKRAGARRILTLLS